MATHKKTNCENLIEYDVLTVNQTKENILNQCMASSEPETVGLHLAHKRVLTNDVISHIDGLGHSNSDMGGYALGGTNLPSSDKKMFPLAGKPLAGSAYLVTVTADSCAHVTTGTVMPTGTDTLLYLRR